MKYKIGDKVRILDIDRKIISQKVGYSNEMEKSIGREGVITQIGDIWYKIDTCKWAWPEEALTLIEQDYEIF